MNGEHDLDRPESRIQLIRGSMTCLTLGLLSLIPFFGLALAVGAVIRAIRLGRTLPRTWNPAIRQLRLGITCAIFGGLLSLFEWGSLIAGLYSSAG